jgi:hypothetical protein
MQAEILRRQPDGSWPAEPKIIPGDELRLNSIECSEAAVRLPDVGGTLVALREIADNPPSATDVVLLAL